MNFAESELIGFLKYNDIAYYVENSGFVFVMSDNECKWKTVCRVDDNCVLIYGMYPFRVSDISEAVLLTNAINGKLVRGSFFVHKNTVVMRTSAVLCDIYTAFEEITNALEYNAGSVTHFWTELSVLQI